MSHIDNAVSFIQPQTEMRGTFKFGSQSSVSHILNEPRQSRHLDGDSRKSGDIVYKYKMADDPHAEPTQDAVFQTTRSLPSLKMLGSIFRRFRRFRRSKKDLWRAEAEQERHHRQTVTELTEENAKLRQFFVETTHMVNLQKAQLAEYDFLLAHALCHTMHAEPTAFQPHNPLPTTSVSSKSPPAPIWIDDIWLCSDPEIRPIRQAQRQWQKGSPDVALRIATNSISSDPFLTPTEELRCRLFVAAALYSLGQYQESNQNLVEILKVISSGLTQKSVQARELTGIAHYIQARNLMALEHHSMAFLMLSRSLDTSGYGEKARELQQKAFIDFVCHDAADDLASDSSSLQPLVGSRGCASSISLESTHYPAW